MSIKEHQEARKNLADAVVAPLPPSPFFLCRGEGAATRRLGKTQQKTRKRAGKNMGNLGPNQAQNSTTLSTMS